MIHKFDTTTFKLICNNLATQDNDLAGIIRAYGHPPMWSRPNTFETLVHIILEQQVSLASALSALNQLRKKVKRITPANVLKLTDAEFKSCYFSRQKTIYVKHLATALQNKQLDLRAMENFSDDDIRTKLITLKGIGNWTIDVYLMFVLQRADIFPLGDLAAVNALKRLKKLPQETSREKLLKITEAWQPYRTVATMILWHYYLSSRVKK
jgi:DNA-3-methyladenine glycosylase II